jgi:hypothetical protein
MVLAEHFTSVGPLVTTTLETVRFEPPELIHFRLVRGPLPYVVEKFRLRETGEVTELEIYRQARNRSLGSRPLVGSARRAALGGSRA